MAAAVLDLWSRSMGVYASTKELRHALVHRRLVVDSATGAISRIAAPGQAKPRPVTADEQSAFCQVAVGAAEAVIGTALPARRAEQLTWALDQLAALHGQRLLGASPVDGLIPRVVVLASPGRAHDLRIDFADIRARAHAAVGGKSHYDIEIRLPDDRALAGALEDAPAGVATVPLSNLPPWLRWI